MRTLVIGAGIGGCAAAIALRRTGHDALVFERAAAAREVGAGVTLWSNALRALRELGCADDAIAAGARIDRALLRDPAGRVLRASDERRAARQRGEPTIVIHRADLLACLLSKLPADLVRFDHAAESVREEGDAAAVRFEGGAEERAEAVIGADGLWSRVRPAVLGDEPPRYRGYICWRGVAPFAHPLARGTLCEMWGRGERFGYAPLPGGRTYWWAHQSVPRERSAIFDETRLRERFSSWAAPAPELLDATPSRAIIRREVLDRAPQRTWTRGRIALLGDAAHPMTPDAGQGAGMALEDAAALGEALRGAGPADIVRTLRAYERARRSRAAFFSRLSRAIGDVGQWSSPVPCAARDAVLRALGAFSPREPEESRTLPAVPWRITPGRP